MSEKIPTDRPTARALASEAADDVPSNDSANATLGDVIAERLSRRDLVRGALAATEAESAANPRARSAKLRAAERTAAPAHAEDHLPDWPRLADVLRGG